MRNCPVEIALPHSNLLCKHQDFSIMSAGDSREDRYMTEDSDEDSDGYEVPTEVYPQRTLRHGVQDIGYFKRNVYDEVTKQGIPPTAKRSRSMHGRSARTHFRPA